MTHQQKIVDLLETLVANKTAVQELSATEYEYPVAGFTIQPSWGICIFIEDNLDLEVKDYVRFKDYPHGTGSSRNPIKSDGGYDYGNNIYLNEERWDFIEWLIETLKEEK